MYDQIFKELQFLTLYKISFVEILIVVLIFLYVLYRILLSFCI